LFVAATDFDRIRYGKEKKGAFPEGKKTAAHAANHLHYHWDHYHTRHGIVARHKYIAK
jgi:hypothetical protein